MPETVNHLGFPRYFRGIYDDLRNCGFRALSIRGFRGSCCLSDSIPANIGDCLQSRLCKVNRGDGGGCKKNLRTKRVNVFEVFVEL